MKAFSATMLALLFTCTFTLAFHIQSVKAAGTIYIRADGSIDPPTAPIQRSGDVYTLTGNVTSDADGIVVERDSIVVDGANYVLQGTGRGNGTSLTATSNITVQNIIIDGFGWGVGSIPEGSSSNITINRSVITNNLNGIRLVRSSDSSINGNNMTKNVYDINLDFSSNSSINGNNMTNGYTGIYMYHSSNSSINGNNITTNPYGIVLVDSSNDNRIRGNTFTDDGLSVWNSYSNVVENNKVNGRPLVYLEDVADHSIEDAGQVILVRCDRIRVEDLNLSRTSVGVQLLKTNNSIISGNIVIEDGYGIPLEYSSNNSISGNMIANNRQDGIKLRESSNNSISGNAVTDNGWSGINVIVSSNNSINGNSMSDNSYYGVWLYYSSNNTICHNNLINDSVQVNGTAIDYPNFWDNGCEGNYWSNYNGTDVDNDGIGDTFLAWQGVDNYPLMNVYWNPCDINHDLKVDMWDVAKSAKAFGSVPGDTRWNPHTDITGPEPLIADEKVDMRDISLITSHYGERH